jgi:hypothetical protein
LGIGSILSVKTRKDDEVLMIFIRRIEQINWKFKDFKAEDPPRKRIHPLKPAADVGRFLAR